MNAARRLDRGRLRSLQRSTVDSGAGMLAAALLERGSGRINGMSVQREFADGDVVPGTRYRVVALIGSGGMGSVYEVEHEELGKRFVLKALLRNLTNRDDLVHRLRNEWRALGRLEHPNIVSVTDAGVTTTGVPFYVMERLQGETLSSRLRRDRRLRPSDALEIAADVLDGLNAAHRIGIVHRDVKPANIFLVGGRVAKLLDFGIAKMLDPKASQITGRGVAIGTPRYMAPEQATGGTVDARTDLYATGLMLFEMIAGTGPFDSARDANELFLAHLAKDAPLVSTTAPGVPTALDGLMARLLAKRPEDRPSDASSVATQLRQLRRGISNAPPASEPSRHDDRTMPGGPFDTLEGAQTVPSERPDSARARHPLNDATTRTGLGPRGSGPQSGQTLRLDALEVSEESEAATRTATPAVPQGQLETPPPVEPSPPATRRTSSARGWVVAAVAVAALAGTATVGLRNRRAGAAATDVSSNTFTAEAPASLAPAAPVPSPSTAATPADEIRPPTGALADGGTSALPQHPKASAASAVVSPAPAPPGSPPRPTPPPAVRRAPAVRAAAAQKSPPPGADTALLPSSGL